MDGKRIFARDYVGQKFGMLTILSVEKNNSGLNFAQCICDCGNRTSARCGHVVAGATKSCGCIIGKSNKTHNMSHTATYNVWNNMRRRCEDENNCSFESYGGRGISVCKEWQEFRNFLADMGEKPKGMSIDRIDNDLGYFKANCKWSTCVDQANNRRKNLLIVFGGKKKTLAEWSKDSGIEYHLLYWRYIIKGWTFEKSINQKTRKKI